MLIKSAFLYSLAFAGTNETDVNSEYNALVDKQIAEQKKDIEQLSNLNAKILPKIDEIQKGVVQVESSGSDSPVIQEVLKRKQPLVPQKSANAEQPIHIVRYIQSTFAELLEESKLLAAEKDITLHGAKSALTVKEHNPNEQRDKLVERARTTESSVAQKYKSKKDLEDAVRSAKEKVKFQKKAAQLSNEELRLSDHMSMAEKAKRIQKNALSIKESEYELLILSSTLQDWDKLQATAAPAP